MANWILCPTCNLRHSLRPEGICPRCGEAVDRAVPTVALSAERSAGQPARLGSCHVCLRAAPTKHVELYQNIGALVVRFHKSLKGDLCRQCIDKYFWEYTLLTLFLGWWGTISFIVTPFFLLNNVFRYVGSRSLQAA